VDTQIIAADQAERTNCPDVARALREIASNLVDAAIDQVDSGLPSLGVHISIQPRGDEDTRVLAVDAVARAVLGKAGAGQRMHDGTWHHSAQGHVGPVMVSVLTGVASPAERELAELRAKVASYEQAQIDEARALTPDTRPYRCEGCGKTSRLVKHEDWCPVQKAWDAEQVKTTDAGSVA
jgi:methionine synthase II (cobalamin-independent)